MVLQHYTLINSVVHNANQVLPQDQKPETLICCSRGTKKTPQTCTKILLYKINASKIRVGITISKTLAIPGSVCQRFFLPMIKARLFQCSQNNSIHFTTPKIPASNISVVNLIMMTMVHTEASVNMVNKTRPGCVHILCSR